MSSHCQFSPHLWFSQKAASALDSNCMSCTCFSFMELHLRTSFDLFKEIGIEQLEFAPFFLSDNGRREP